MLQNVGENIQRELRMLRQDLGIEGRVLTTGIGVDLAADRFDLFGDVARAAPARPFENHVL